MQCSKEIEGAAKDGFEQIDVGCRENVNSCLITLRPLESQNFAAHPHSQNSEGIKASCHLQSIPWVRVVLIDEAMFSQNLVRPQKHLVYGRFSHIQQV